VSIQPFTFKCSILFYSCFILIDSSIDHKLGRKSKFLTPSSLNFLEKKNSLFICSCRRPGHNKLLVVCSVLNIILSILDHHAVCCCLISTITGTVSHCLSPTISRLLSVSCFQYCFVGPLLTICTRIVSVLNYQNCIRYLLLPVLFASKISIYLR